MKWIRFTRLKIFLFKKREKKFHFSNDNLISNAAERITKNVTVKKFSPYFILPIQSFYIPSSRIKLAKKLSNKDDNWVIYVVLPVPILGTYYTMYPIFWHIQNRGSRVIYQRPLVMFWQGRWQGRNWSISGTAWSSGVCKIWITVTSCCYCGMKNTPALYIYIWNCYHQLF